MRLIKAFTILLGATLSNGGQSPAVQAPAYPVFHADLLKDAPPGMQNPNNLGNDHPLAGLPDATPEQQALTAKAFEYANKVAADPAFKEAVLHMNVPGCYQKNYYHDDFTFSDAAVYKLLLTSSATALNVIWYDGERPEGKGSNQGYEVDIFPNTVGVNRNAVAQENSPEKQAAFVASLLLHEASHVAGFKHPFCVFHARSRSVPYNMNAIYDEVAPKLGLPVSDY